MENKGLNKVDLIFEKVDAKEVLKKAFKMTSVTRLSSRFLTQVLRDEEEPDSLPV